MGTTKEDVDILFKECRYNDRETLIKLAAVADDIIQYIEQYCEMRKVFGNLLKTAIKNEIESIRFQQKVNQDDMHRRIILCSLDLLCRFLSLLENLIISSDQSNNSSKKQKRTNSTHDSDWSINERDEILHLFTDLIQLDLRQFWHETERLEDSDIGVTIVDVCLIIIRNNQYSTRTRTVKDYLSFILAVTIGLFRIEEETSMKMIQMLQIQEHAATIYSAVIICHVKHFRTDSLLERIINDICHLCLSQNHVPSSMLNPNETNSSRTMAKLLDELSNHLSDHLILYINRLLDLFDSDCLQMRNSLLNVCTNIIRSCSTQPEYQELRGELFLLIIDQYFLDCNVHVRSHAMGLCQTLVESKLIPTKFYCHLTGATIERMNDVSCIVRKHAIQLGTKLLKHNPYTDRFLPIDVMLDEYNREMNKLIQLQKLLGKTLKIEKLPDDQETKQETENRNDLDNQHLLFERIVEQQQLVRSMYSEDEFLPSFERYNQEMTVLIQLQSKLNTCLPASSDLEIVDDEGPIERGTRLFDNMVKQSKLVSYLHNATEFCNIFRRFLAQDALFLLSSKTNSDVLEMIEFLVLWSTFEYRSKVYKRLEQNLFSLIWNNDKNISTAVINAFKRICLKIDEGDNEEKNSSNHIIEKLLDQIDLNLNLTFEHILKHLLNESTLTAGDISSFIDLVLDYYLKLTIDQSKKYLSNEFFKQIQQRQSTFLRLIVFVIPYDRKQRLTSKFSSILQTLINQAESKDLNYFRYQIEIVANLMTKKSSSTDSNELINLMENKLVNSTTESNIHIWNELMRETLRIHCQYLSDSESSENCPIQFLQSLSDQINWPCSINGPSTKIILIRFLNSIDAFLMNQVERFDSGKLKLKRKISIEHDSETNVNLTAVEEDEDQDQNGDEEQDEQSEFSSSQQQNSGLVKLENEILQENTLFSSIEKWIQTFIYEDHKEADEQLVLSCISTCTRMMYVSTILCNKYVNRIFELSKSCPFSSVRSLLIVSLGDLLLRHPNIIEPFTPEFYAKIHDQDLSVSETALSTIAILILREMIKVRGYISEIALCLFHHHTPIASIAQHFFDELSLRQRGLALFNVLPDIISRLSVKDTCPVESFQQIISHLFSFIKNDRHCEILVKRLCRQFKQASGDDSKRANIAFCLGKLNIKTMTSYRILKENFPNVTDNDDESNVNDDQEEHLAWKRYLYPILNEIERRLKPNELNSTRRQSSSTTPKKKER